MRQSVINADRNGETAKPSRWSRALRGGAVAAALALVCSGLVVPPAAAHEYELPTSPSLWPSAYSPLPTAELVGDNSRALTFDGTDPGLHDADGQDTGFTMVQPSSADQSAAIDPTAQYQGYYLPQFLNVADGKLTLNPTKGIAFLTPPANAAGNDRWKNTQDNTLGVPIDPAGTKMVFTTTLSMPSNAADSAQGGIWFGPNDDNYLKLVVAATSATVRQVQLSREVGGVTNTAAGTIDQVSVNNLTIPATTPVTLALTVDALTNTASATYRLGTGASVNVGSVPLPANFTNGDLVPAVFDTPDAQTNGFAGLFATRRNMANETVAVPFVFDDFTVTELDSVAPAAPADLSVSSSPQANQLQWNPPADADIAGYRVYRSATAPVATTAENLLTPGLIAETTYADGAVFVGQSWNYAVHAVDASGNVSPAAAVAAVVPAPTGDLVGKYDFTTAAGPVSAGYTRDSGAAYSGAAGFGWVTADGDGPFDFSLNSRVRTDLNGITDTRLTTLVHMQYGTSSTPNPTTGVVSEQGVWELAVPNGRYNVVVAAGDTSNGNFDSSHTLMVEGATAVDHFSGAAPLYFDQGVVEVEVLDGRLTVAPGVDAATKNTKISFVEVYALPTPPLDAVDGLAATHDDESDTVQLNWAPVDGAEGYNVYRSTTSPVDTTSPLNSAPLTTTSFTDDDVAPDATYHYTVVAISADAPSSAPAAEVSVTIPAEPVVIVPPAAPGGVTATADADSIVVDWDAVADATGYRVYRSTTTTISTAGEPLAQPQSTSFDDATAVIGTTYYYVVVAVKQEGEAAAVSAASAVVSASVAQTPPPGACELSEWSVDYFAGSKLAGAPVAELCVGEIDQSFAAGVAPTAGVSSTYYSARFSKTIDEGAGTYVFDVVHDDGVRVFVDGEQIIGAWFNHSGQTPKTASVNLAAGPHEIVVEYYQATGDAKLIVSYERTGAPDTTPPAPPTDVAATATDDSRLVLTWDASTSSDVAGYNLYRSTQPNVAVTAANKRNVFPITDGDYLDIVEADTTYYYVMTAVDQAGNESVASSETSGIHVSTPDEEAPAAPTGLTAANGDGEVTLTWIASTATDVSGYRVYRSLEAGAFLGDLVVSGDQLVAGTTWNDAAADNGTTYFYQVTAVDTSGNESSPSNEAYDTPRETNDVDVKVDFTATDAVPAPGYLADWGQAYGARTSAGQGTGYSFGWTDDDGHAVSLVGNGRDRERAGIDPRLDSVVHMQYADVDGGNGANGVKIDGQWELALPGGLYEVTVAVGDQAGAEAYDSQHVINVEGSLAINGFQGSASQEYTTYTATVGVWDGRLTLDALGGFNTKIAYVDVLGVPFEQPHVTTISPENREAAADPQGGVAANFAKVHAGGGVDNPSMIGNVRVFKVADGTEVAGTVNSSGGNDTINFYPDGGFLPNTAYRLEIGPGVKDLFGNAFLPFSSVFTTGAGVIIGGDEFTPLTNVAFEKVEITLPGVNKFWASFTFGPDGKLYGSTIGQGLYRFTVNADGTLSNMEDLGYQGYAMIGLLWDKSSTATDMRLWVTKTSANVGNEQAQFISGISLLTGANLQNEKKIFSGLPRSQSDHLTNSMVYGPNDDILVLQGSNQAAGDLDGSWGQRGEQLLTAALLHFDPDHPRIQAAVADAEGDNPQLVQTASSGLAGENAANGYNAAAPYNPFAANAPLKIYATGIRNAYDLTYHSNGHIYVATNGTAGGGNSPGVNYNAAAGTFTRVAAPGIPGFSSVNGQDVTAACQARVARTAADPTVPDYVPTSVPAVGNHPTQRDHLYDVKQGWYYGHPNPTRCEFVLHEGNDPANPPKWAGQGGSKYGSGVKAEPNYGGVAYDFEFNKSPNGTIEYKSETFGGQLKNRIVVVRFSNNNDLIFLQADRASGEILGGQTEVGITGVANSTIGGVGGFNDPLEVVEDTRNGNLYLNQYDRAGNQQKLYLLRVPANQQAAKIGVDKSELVFSAVTSNGPLVDSTAAHRTDAESITVTNSSPETQALSVSVTGANASEFAVQGTVPTSLAPGASATFTVRFTPGTTAGNRSAALTVTGGPSTVSVGLHGLAMSGIQGGYEPTFAQVVTTLGFNVNVGWTNLAGGMQPVAKGDEVLEPLFVKAGSANVTWKPLSHYAPADSVTFGWYSGDGTADQRTVLGSMDGTKSGGYQSLLPPTGPNSTMTFDPGQSEFGLFYYSPYFNRYGFTEDRLNSPAASAHRARIYPAKNRNGVAIPNSYLVAFEDADNGDYQDYVFLVTGLKPVTDTGSGGDAVKVDFTTASGDLAAGYLRDYGQAFGPRTGAGQGSGLTFGWKNVDNEDDLDISVGGTTNAGNGRDRNSAQSDMRLDSFMHMQPETVPSFNGTPLDAYWEMQVPNGVYQVTIGVGDPSVNSDPEVHAVDVEGVNVVSAFTPSGAAGSNGRHKVSTATVTVTDGHLTVIGSGVNTKIGFIDIVPSDGPTNPGGDDPSDGAQVKVRFQPAAAPLSDGWTAETGAAFSTQRGYGWLNAATDQPVDRTVATRHRTAPVAGIAYPTDERLKTYAFLDNSTQPTYTTGYWEYVVPNGTYEVGVSVGDANYIDSTHGVLVEGQPIINGFVPTGATPFQTGVRTVAVTDGRLTISNSGTNTKVNWVSIKGDALTPTDPTALARYSFRPATAPVPAGWTADTGTAYNAVAGHGWLVDGIPTDRSAMTRVRTAPAGDVTRQGLILMQSTTTSGSVITGGTTGVWERALANGTYTVSASVGDADFTDSVHGLTAEGTALISGFAPTTGTMFATGTAEVTVTDGKLTLQPTGVNTKLNWVTISGTAITAPSVIVNVNGAPVQDQAETGEAVVTASAVAASGASISSFTYSVNGGAAQTYGAPIALSTAGEYVLVFQATDSEGRTTTRTVELTVLNIGGTLAVSNMQLPRQAGGAPLAGLSDDVVVLHRMNAGTTSGGTLLYRTYDSATVNLTNTGTKDLRVTSLALGGAQPAGFELVDAPALPLTLAPGATQPLTVRFIADSGAKGVRTATITIASSDPAAANKTLQLRGGYMAAPEGNSELSLEQIFQLFNSATTSGSAGLGLGNGSELPGAALDGDEHRSALWQRMDTTKPVQAVQLAAFHGQGGTETFTVGNLSATMTGLDAQSIYPKTGAGALTAINGVPNAATFAIGVNGKLTSRTDYIAVKTWPVKNAAGAIVPGAWFVGHDYVSSGGGPTSPGGCGNGATNCDFQDNVYLVTNVLPVTGDAQPPAAPAAPTGAADATGVNLSWAASTSSDVIGYRVERSATSGGTYTAISGGGLVAGTTFRDTAAAPAATTYYRVVAVDATGNAAPGTSAAVDTSALVMAPIRINAGGGAVTLNGVAWQADTFFSGGKSYSNSQVQQIAGTNDDLLYQSERSSTTDQGSFSYAIPVPASGNYQVTLHFAEIYHGATGGGAGGTGKRVFSVNMEGGPVEVVNLDLNSKVAPMTAYTETRTIPVTDGTLNLAFTATVNQPKVSAIEVIRVP